MSWQKLPPRIRRPVPAQADLRHSRRRCWRCWRKRRLSFRPIV